MQATKFLDILQSLSGGLYTGVPDSLLSPFIDAVMERHGISEKHIVAANEGAAVGIAAGHFLATSKPAVVYMQNSGIGNAVNPICSLLHEKVYSIPAIFVIGWRGEPGVKDEPQHVFQGEITLSLLDNLEIPYIVISGDDDLEKTVNEFSEHLKNGRSVAFVIKKGALQNDKKYEYSSGAKLSREEALGAILSVDTTDSHSVNSPIYVCTTGKLSREVYEIREQQGAGHGSDFLTVGSMGHSLMIAYGIALEKPKRQVFCLDGDGAVLMHMGSLATIGVHKPKNLIHIVINNGAHETVGGLPTVGENLDFSKVAESLGYKKASRATEVTKLVKVIKDTKSTEGPFLIEVICNLSSRSDLGRPTTTPAQNRDELMENLLGSRLKD
ncbi:MAG: phosphonopyruvate decarboxylase [Oscillospiraceae bacterium]|nr:phosphonopyruvate decarboxylase [Oscillospiraceae bacterium]